ncbi:Gfo/Idh/MocA family protein [Rubellimicrobium aerolatum]|uniref:Gfo/Idh/MocA family protein n=1 Tax=Rubellimicrobium aerolatum TaxID=490979 RepID=A0ABW0SH94_9RHOB|nr:Gfo/Idh/MocA family oxidoreductase [Rubellimicrobium aerolatum]MBP1807320.1 putative dehydrogenase [Rubellimicrobium aerolatum]
MAQDIFTAGLSRRGFMAGASGIAAGAVLAGAAQAQESGQGAAEVVRGEDPPNRLVGRPAEIETELRQPEARRVGWAVAGLGHFATSYQIPALGRARYSELKGLVSGNPEKAAEIARRTGVAEGSVYSYDSFDSIRDNPEIEVVYVVTPNSLHRDLVIRAFEAGKHVMVEKPMATTPEDAEAMIAARDAAGRKLMVAYRAHFEPINLMTATMIREGRMGDLSFLSSDHHRPLVPEDPKDQWRMKRDLAGGGSFTDIGIYSLNGVIWFMGEAPEALSARTHSPPGDARFAEVEAVCTVQLRFPSGRLATLSSGYIADKKRIDVWGSEAVAVLDPATEYMGNRLMVSMAQGTQEMQSEFGSQVQFDREIDHLSQAILTDSDVKTPGEMGLRDVRLIAAVYRSAAEAGRWIELNEDGSARG